MALSINEKRTSKSENCDNPLCLTALWAIGGSLYLSSPWETDHSVGGPLWLDDRERLSAGWEGGREGIPTGVCWRSRLVLVTHLQGLRGRQGPSETQRYRRAQRHQESLSRKAGRQEWSGDIGNGGTGCYVDQGIAFWGATMYTRWRRLLRVSKVEESLYN